MLLEDIEHAHEVVQVAERIITSLQQPFTLAGRDLFISTSIGVATDTGGTLAPEELLRNADAAMYRAKERGKARYEVFDPEVTQELLDRVQLETELRHALERGELRLHYQPVVRLSDGAIRGVEALLCWQHPQRGLLSPIEFAAVAEDAGLIIPIGQWGIAEACRQAAEWQGQHPEKLLVMAVNLSARQLQHPTLIADVARVVQTVGLAPSNLVLEITEGTVMQDIEFSRVVLRELKDLGVRVALDDFGTGYSSLSYLRWFPIDVLKVDRSFTEVLGRDPSGEAIVEAVLTLARTMGIQEVVEGVETAEQVAELRALGSNFAQGYYFARPAPAETVAQLLTDSPSLPSPLGS